MLTVGTNEAESKDGGQKSAVQRNSVHVGQLFTEAAAVEKQKNEPVDTGEQVTEESEPVVKMDETEPADEEIPAECILLCIEGFLMGFLSIPYRQWCHRLFCEHCFCRRKGT